MSAVVVSIRRPAPGTGDENGNENRQHDRSKTLRGALIVFNNGWSTKECTILDISEGGARLRTSDFASNCPDEFKLRSSATGQSRLCEVVWRKGTELGVRWVKDIADF